MSRTRDFAKSIIAHLQEPTEPEAKEQLNELDYGRWRKKSNGAIVAAGGQKELDAWSKNSAWPTDAEFAESPNAVRARTHGFVRDVTMSARSNDVVVVGHNGQLRYFLSLVRGAEATHFQKGTFKLGCGHMGLLTRASVGAPWNLIYWNLAPELAHPLGQTLVSAGLVR